MLWLGNSKKHKSCLTNYNSKATLEWVGVGSFLKKWNGYWCAGKKLFFRSAIRVRRPLNRATKLKAIKNRNMLLFYLIYFYYCRTQRQSQRDRGCWSIIIWRANFKHKKKGKLFCVRHLCARFYGNFVSAKTIRGPIYIHIFVCFQSRKRTAESESDALCIRTKGGTKNNTV